MQGVWDAEEEARNVAAEAEDLHRQGHAFSQMAVLVRASFQMREFEDRFLSLGIPYRVIGGPRFYERAEIRDAMAYLRLVAQGDDDLAFERIVNKPKRGIGDASVQRAAPVRARAADAAAGGRARDRRDRRIAAQGAQIAGRAGRRFRALERDRASICRIPTWPKWCWTNAAIPTCSSSTNRPKRRAGSTTSRSWCARWRSSRRWAAFLEHVSLVMELVQNETEDRVNLMTMHAAKGLEFDTVFLPGWEEGLFPEPAHHGRERAGGPRRGTPPRLCRA